MNASRLKRIAWLALLPLAAFAGIRDDYAQQWPLTLSREDAGAYRLVLDRTVYEHLQTRTLRDLEVLNADGNAVAASLFDAEQPLAKPVTSVEVPWFPLPASSGPSRDIASISEIATDGSLRRVIMQEVPPGATPGGNDGYLIDTSRLQSEVQALQVAWNPGQAPFDLGYRVAASDDLKQWRAVQQEGRLVELQNNGERILKNRIELQPVKAKYLRLIPLHAGQRALLLVGVSAELASLAVAPSWEWESLSGTPVVDADGSRSFHFEVEGRFPFERVDVMSPGNHSNEWALQSRDDPAAEWRTATAPWVAFQLQGGKDASRSPPQSLQGINRDRYWRLVSTTWSGPSAPTLALGYRPEVVVFLAQGQPPYALVAGSARAQRAEAPLSQLVEALRAERGEEWQPATATLGKPQVLAGDKALTPAPVERDWKAWLLWALLIGGALIVAGFAFSLLKKPPAKS